MGVLFPPSWIKRMQKINRDNLDCLAAVYRIPDGTDPGDVDGEGNIDETPVLVVEDVPCRLNRWSTQPTLGIVSDSLQSESRWLVTFDVGERRVQSGHLLTVSGSTNGTPWERSLKVVMPLDPVSDEVMVQVLCNAT